MQQQLRVAALAVSDCGCTQRLTWPRTTTVTTTIAATGRRLASTDIRADFRMASARDAMRPRE